uniref:F-box domain-containing protein n=1 Tax=Mycena chlorophos TaxID=658473 RepID=A0ABQ0M274_MYCCL|nr:predicted protein [Mycena chlorophos]
MSPFSRLYDLFFSAASQQPCTSLTAPRHAQLPLEIVIHILEEACASEQDPAPLLRNAALVCRDWSFIAQPLLFRDVVLASQTACDAFLSAAHKGSARGHMLANAVSQMKVVLDANQPQALSQQSFARAVIACPNLCELDVAMYGRDDLNSSANHSTTRRSVPTFDASTLDVLRAAGPRMKSLHFNNASDSDACIFQLLDVFSSLESLALSGTPPKLPAMLHAPRYPGVVQELRLNCQTAVSVDFIRWLLGNSEESQLKTLELEREQPMEVVDHLVATHANSLRSLAVPACTTHDMAAAVNKCTNLDELRIEHPWVTPVLVKALSRKLQRLAIALDQDSVVQPWVDYVRHAERLEALTVQVWGTQNESVQQQQLPPPALMMACAYRGTMLETTQDIKVFRSVVRREPVVPSPFSMARK